MDGNFSKQLILFLSGFSGGAAYAAILGTLLVCGLGVPVPEDITLIAAGILAAMETISLTGALIAGFVGVLIGDSFLFFIGRKFGRRVFELPLFRSVFTPERIQAAEKRILHNAKFICFTARFLPGLRAPIYLTSGIMGVSPFVFLGLDGLAALVSVPIWVIGGWWFGKNIAEALLFAKEMQTFIIVGVLLLIVCYVAIKLWISYRRSGSGDTQSPH